MRCTARLLLLLAFAGAACWAQNTMTVTAANIQNARGQTLASGQACFAPVNNAGTPMSYQPPGGGQTVTTPVCTAVTNGALSISLPNTNLTTPVNVCFHLTVRDLSTGQLVLGNTPLKASGYECVQPNPNAGSWCSGSGCDLDNFPPNLVPQQVVTAPQQPTITDSGSAFVTVMGANIQNALGQKLAAGQACFQASNNVGTPISFQAAGGGQVANRPVCTPVGNGAFSVSLANTAQTNPRNVCYRLTVKDSSTNQIVLGSATGETSGYDCLQTAGSNNWCSGSVCDLDNYPPNMAALATVQTGPQGPAGPVGVSTANGTNGGFNVPGVLTAATVGTRQFRCDYDWNADGIIGPADIKACLDAASAYLGSAENGTDESADVQLPAGTFDLSTVAGMCPYPLHSGMCIHGVRPRLEWIAGTNVAARGYAPDLNMVPNGGTWLACGSGNRKVMFTANQVRGLCLADFGATNYQEFLQSGGEQQDGLAWAHFSDLYLIGLPGGSTSTTITSFDLTNFQHVYAEHINQYGVDTAWKLTSWNCNWQPGNSVFVDTYQLNRQIAVTTPLLWFRVQTSSSPTGCTEQNPDSLNYLTWIRPQVSAYTGTASGSSAIRIDGGNTTTGLTGLTMIGLDLETDTDHPILSNSAFVNSYLDVANCAVTSANAAQLDSSAYAVTIRSGCDRLKWSFANTYNTLIGSADSFPGAYPAPGLYSQRVFPGNPNPVFTVNTQQFTNNPVVTALNGYNALFYGNKTQSYVVGTDTTNTPTYYSDFHEIDLNPSTASTNQNLVGAFRRNAVFQSVPVTIANWVNYWSDFQPFTSSATVFQNAYGFYSQFENNLGSNWTAQNYTAFYSAPLPALASGASMQYVFGLRVGDLMSLGSAMTNPVAIDAQTGTSPDKGNFYMIGGGFSTGHIKLYTGHIWFDVTNSKFRFNTGLPANEQNGLSLGPETTPTSSSTPCTQGAWSFDNNYYYICSLTNQWKRVPLQVF
jgi:hypothetical protein